MSAALSPDGDRHPSRDDRPLRSRQLAALDGGDFDVFIIGGGINGAVSAAALADRGLRVAIVDRDDFGGFTSQESSNLVWGGFKYLQHYELPLVYKLCRSRNRLMEAYPTAVAPIGFLATLDETAPFPSWLAAVGSLAYWAIGRFATERPRYLRPSVIEELEPAVNTESANAGIEYFDGYIKDNDSRFVWSFVRSALDRGAVAANYVAVDEASRDDSRWRLDLSDQRTGERFEATARVLVNATGPFVDGLNDTLKVDTDHRIVYSKGIHLIVPQISAAERVLAFFDDTQRLFYVIPMAHRSVIGTTDSRTTNPHEPISDDEREFLLAQINQRLDLQRPLTRDDIIAERSGVRPLVVPTTGDDQTHTDWTSLSRRHEIEVDDDRAVVSIFGGKLTDCLNVGDEVVNAVADLGLTVGIGSDNWYGEPPAVERERFERRAAAVGLDRPPDIERAATVAEVLWRRHGLAAHLVVDAIEADPRGAEPVIEGTDVLRAELALYRDREMVVEPDDLLRRRTKLALLFRTDELAADPGMGEILRTLPPVQAD